MCVSAPHICTTVEARRRCRILGSCNYRRFRVTFVCCKSNPGPQEEKPLLLTTEPALWFDFPFSSIHALCVTQAGLQLLVSPLIPSAGITVVCHHTSCNYRVLNFLLSLSVFAQTLPLFSPLKKQTGCPKEGTVVGAGIRSLCIFLTFLLLC